MYFSSFNYNLYVITNFIFPGDLIQILFIVLVYCNDILCNYCSTYITRFIANRKTVDKKLIVKKAAKFTNFHLSLLSQISFQMQQL